MIVYFLCWLVGWLPNTELKIEKKNNLTQGEKKKSNVIISEEKYEKSLVIISINVSIGLTVDFCFDLVELEILTGRR